MPLLPPPPQPASDEPRGQHRECCCDDPSPPASSSGTGIPPCQTALTRPNVHTGERRADSSVSRAAPDWCSRRPRPAEARRACRRGSGRRGGRPAGRPRRRARARRTRARSPAARAAARSAGDRGAGATPGSASWVATLPPGAVATGSHGLPVVKPPRRPAPTAAGCGSRRGRRGPAAAAPGAVGNPELVALVDERAARQREQQQRGHAHVLRPDAVGQALKSWLESTQATPASSAAERERGADGVGGDQGACKSSKLKARSRCPRYGPSSALGR